MAVVTPIEAPKLGIPVAELLAVEIDPIEWLIPGYIQEQSISVLAGPPNSGKTLLAFDWCAQAVARGKRVFIGQNEGGLRGLQDRLRRACTAAGIMPPPERFTYRRNMDVSLSDLHGVKQIAKELEFYDLINLDSLSSFWPGLNENDPEHMSMVAEALKVLCEHSGAAVLGNHHTTKAAWKMGEKPSLGDIRGHGAMAGRIDAAFICKPMERVAGLVRLELHVVKQRDEDWTPPKAVEVVMTGDAATVTTEPLGALYKTGTPLDHRNREIEQAVLLVLPDTAEEAVTGNDICSRTKKAKSDVLSAIRRLFQRQAIMQDFRGRYFRVKGQPSDPGSVRRTSPSAYRPYQPPESD